MLSHPLLPPQPNPTHILCSALFSGFAEGFYCLVASSLDADLLRAIHFVVACCKWSTVYQDLQLFRLAFNCFEFFQRIKPFVYCGWLGQYTYTTVASIGITQASAYRRQPATNHTEKERER